MINTEWKIRGCTIENADGDLIAVSTNEKVLDAISTIPSAVDLFKRLLDDNHFKSKGIREEVWGILADLDFNYVSGDDEPLTTEIE